jgi:hypothetical protein
VQKSAGLRNSTRARQKSVWSQATTGELTRRTDNATSCVAVHTTRNGYLKTLCPEEDSQSTQNSTEVVEDERSAKDLASGNGSSGDEEEKEEPKVTLSKKAKGKKVISKSLASDVKRDAAGRIGNSSRVEVDPAVHEIVTGEYREMCVRCAKEVNTFPDLRRWFASNSKSIKCADCQTKGKVGDPVSSPAVVWLL